MRLNPSGKATPDPALDGIVNAVKEALPRHTKPGFATIEVAGRTYRALAIPVNVPSGVGALTLKATDIITPAGDELLSLPRHYSSADTRPGPFGRGWHLLLPELRFRGTGERRAAVITDSWRIFEVPVQPPLFREVRSGAEGYTIVAADNSVSEFGLNRKLARQKGARAEWRYAYEGDRLVRLTAEKDKEVLGFLELTWNSRGQITRVKDHKEAEVTFEYDERQRLLSARSGARSVHYKYSAGDRLTAVVDGERTWTYSCTAEGYLLKAAADGAEVKYLREETAEKGVRLRLSGAVAADLTYDARGRLVRQERGGVSVRHGDDGEKSTQELLIAGKPYLRAAHDRVARTLELVFPGCRCESYDLGPDGRPLRLMVAAGGKTMQVQFDARGVPRNLSDPAGGSYHLVQGIGNLKLVTPAGSYSVTNERKGAALRVGVPSGGEILWRREGGRTVVMEVIARGKTCWNLTAGVCEVWRDDRVIARARTDERNRILELVDLLTDCKVSARYGTSAHVVRTPEGRQLLFRCNNQGQLEEIEEHPVGAGPVPSR